MATTPSPNADTIIGSGAVNDRINALGGDDRVEGNDGNDVLEGDTGDDVLIGGRGNDSLAGGEGDDVLSGGEGNDFLHVGRGAGADRLEGGAGDDEYFLGADGGRASSFDDNRSSNDSHQVSLGFGARVTVQDNGGSRDTLGIGDLQFRAVFGRNITPADLSLSRPRGTNNLLIKSPFGQVTVLNYFLVDAARGINGRIENIVAGGQQVIVPTALFNGTASRSGAGVSSGRSVLDMQVRSMLQEMSQFSSTGPAAAVAGGTGGAEPGTLAPPVVG